MGVGVSLPVGLPSLLLGSLSVFVTLLCSARFFVLVVFTFGGQMNDVEDRGDS